MLEKLEELFGIKTIKMVDSKKDIKIEVPLTKYNAKDLDKYFKEQ